MNDQFRFRRASPKYGKYWYVGLTAARQTLASPASVIGRVALFVVILTIFSRLWRVAYAGGASPAGDAVDLTWYMAVTEWVALAVPFLQNGTGVSAIGFIAAMAVASTIVDVSPFSTNGALVLANAQGVDRQAFFRRLLAYGAIVTVVAPIVLWLIFIVVPG